MKKTKEDKQIKTSKKVEQRKKNRIESYMLLANLGLSCCCTIASQYLVYSNNKHQKNTRNMLNETQTNKQ
jgi:hypothetical protein